MSSIAPQPVPQPAPSPAMANQGNAMAITGFTLASVALLLCLIPIVNNFAAVLAILGFVFGIIGIVRARSRRRPYRGLAIAAVVVAVTAFVGVIASQAFYSSAIDEVSEALDEVGSDLDKMAGESTEEILENDLAVDIGSFKGETDEVGFAEGSLRVKLTNKADETYSYEVYIEAVDSSGDRVGEDWAYSSDLRSGQSESFDLFAFATGDEELQQLKSAEFRIIEVSQY